MDAIIKFFFRPDTLCRVTPSEHGVPKINAPPWLHPIAHSTACNRTLYLLYLSSSLIFFHLFPKPQIKKSIQQNNDTKLRPSIHASLRLILFSFAYILCLLYTISLNFCHFFMFMLVIMCVCVCVRERERESIYGRVYVGASFGNLIHVKAHLFLPSLT